MAAIAQTMGVDVETAVLRHREMVDGLAEEAQRIRAAAVVVRGQGVAQPWHHYRLDRAVRTLRPGLPCAVITLHLPEPRPRVWLRESARMPGGHRPSGRVDKMMGTRGARV